MFRRFSASFLALLLLAALRRAARARADACAFCGAVSLRCAGTIPVRCAGSIRGDHSGPLPNL